MVYYNYEDDLSKESVDKFIGWLNNHPAGEITVYLNSDGGLIASYKTLLSIFNDQKDRIRLIATGFIGSAAFELFFSAECKKDMLLNTAGMYHLHGSLLRVNNNGDIPSKSHIGVKRSLKKELEYIKVFLKSLSFTEKEEIAILKGKDVFFDSMRMQEIFKGLNNG